MRQGQNPNKQRGRSNGGGGRPYNAGGGGNNGGQRRSGVPNRNQNYDSSGPDVRIRGSAYQVYEKYLNLALDATSVGDRIMAESFYQHAEHYYRIINIIEYGPEDERRPDQQNNRQNDENGGQTGRLYQPGYEGNGEIGGGEGEDEHQPEPQQYARHPTVPRQDGNDREPQQQDGNRFQNPRNQNDRNQRFDQNQRRDNRRPQGGSGEPAPDEAQQPSSYNQRPPQERQPREYGQRRDSRPAQFAANEPADPQMQGSGPARGDEGEDDAGALPDFIRRRSPRVTPSAEPATDDQFQRPSEGNDQPE